MILLFSKILFNIKNFWTIPHVSCSSSDPNLHKGREESQSFIIPQNCFTTSQKQDPLLKQFFWKFGCNCINISMRKTSVFKVVYSVSVFVPAQVKSNKDREKTDFTRLCNFDFDFLQNYKSKLGHWKYGNVVVLQILEAAGHEFCNGSEYDLQHPKTCSQTHKKRKKNIMTCLR